MRAVSRGINKAEPTGKLCHIITPKDMMPSDSSPYERLREHGHWNIVDDIHTRIGILIRESEDCQYIVVYGGGIGTIHELMSILVRWYHHTERMPYILICTEDAEDWCNHIAGLLAPLCVEDRPYILIMRQRMFKVSTLELENILRSGEVGEASHLIPDNRHS